MIKKIHIKPNNYFDNSYDIIIDTKLDTVAREIAKWDNISKYFIITDFNVKSLYGNKFFDSLRSHKVDAYLISVPAGEKSKNRETKEKIEDKLFKLKANRNSLIMALGGGMIGDLAGFTAATFMRGIPYIQIPTTLLSQVDSSIGGKVGVNHTLGKNLIGAFYQPKKVYIDVNTLETLPQREFQNGMAEVIKYATILDSELFSFLEKHHLKILNHNRFFITHLIHRCCKLKKIIVEKDERETGLRRILNFGHTIGHAIESLSNYKLSHGEAIAIGMVAEARISYHLGMLKKSDVERLKNLIQLYKLPTEIPKTINIKEIVEVTMHDKKVLQEKVQYTLIDKVGRAVVGVEVSQKIVERILSK